MFFRRMDGDLYDEFGNYIGPELESDESGAESDHDEEEVRTKRGWLQYEKSLVS